MFLYMNKNQMEIEVLKSIVCNSIKDMKYCEIRLTNMCKTGALEGTHYTGVKEDLPSRDVVPCSLTRSSNTVWMSVLKLAMI